MSEEKEFHVYSAFSGVGGLGGPITSAVVIFAGYRERGGEIVEARGRLLIPGNEADYRKYSKKIKNNSVIRVLGSLDGEGDILAAKVLKTGAKPDPAEAAFLERQAQPVSFADGQFGVFELNKSINSYDGQIDILGNTVSVGFEEKEALETLREMAKDFAGLLSGAAAFAAGKLLELANTWGDDGWDEEEEGRPFTPLTEKDFTERITLMEISLWDGGEYALWYDDGDMFWGHAVTVYGSLAEGFTDARMEG
ncbi:MAG: DUF2262 domain-containing protein [Acidaminococcales bacterium]|nr:DUF2262 domain-containing protein [Acidaminococcales bacterium]